MTKPKRREATYTMRDVQAALAAVKVEVRSQFNPFPQEVTMADIRGIEEFYEQLRRIAKAKARKKARRG
jgi:hypothetical protein